MLVVVVMLLGELANGAGGKTGELAGQRASNQSLGLTSLLVGKPFGGLTGWQADSWQAIAIYIKSSIAVKVSFGWLDSLSEP